MLVLFIKKLLQIVSSTQSCMLNVQYIQGYAAFPPDLGLHLPHAIRLKWSGEEYFPASWECFPASALLNIPLFYHSYLNWTNM